MRPNITQESWWEIQTVLSKEVNRVAVVKGNVQSEITVLWSHAEHQDWFFFLRIMKLAWGQSGESLRKIQKDVWRAWTIRALIPQKG